MAAAMTTHEDAETRASNLEVAFKNLQRDSGNLKRQLGESTRNVSPNDRRVAPWMSRFKQRLNESYRWINDLEQQDPLHDMTYMDQIHYY